MATWDKQLGKHTKSYAKRLERSGFNEEEIMVFKTITLMSLNSIIYFVEAMKEGNSNFTGIKPKQWGIALKTIAEENIHELYEAITYEYFKETLDSGKYPERFRLEDWMATFEKFAGSSTKEHLVDKAFRSLGIESANRNEMPVMTFVEIFTSLFERIDAMLEKNLENF